MIKKILITIVLLVMALIVAVSIFSRRAPDILRAQIERALNKKVVIDHIEYRFPGEFELEGFTIREKGEPFDGETSFHADRVLLQVSPLTFSGNRLIIDKIEMENATVVIRKLQDDLYQAFSGVMGAAAVADEKGPSPSAPISEELIGRVPLTIHALELKNGLFQYIDYDASPEGFVVLFSKINTVVGRIALPPSAAKTSYHLTADLEQGRGQRAAKVEIDGWTSLASMDTDTSFSLQGVHLPYFKPYYSQVTEALLEDGFADLRAVAKIQNSILDLYLGFELSSLNFQSYEEGADRLFGLKAGEILSFLKDSSGRLKFQITAQWNISDKSVKLRDIFRRSIERSLRETVLGSVGNILINSLQKISDSASALPGKDNLEEKIKKIKDFFKY